MRLLFLISIVLSVAWSHLNSKTAKVETTKGQKGLWTTGPTFDHCPDNPTSTSSDVLLNFAVLPFFGFSVPYPQGYFQAPVRTELRLSGTFGELRPNHFHSGIDIKGQVGQSLYAAAEGYVARIKVQAGGYGKALYIKHPNGYTTVYAHMQKFDPAIEAYVKRSQYQKQSFEIDLYPRQGQFAFDKGEKVGDYGAYRGDFGAASAF